MKTTITIVLFLMTSYMIPSYVQAQWNEQSSGIANDLNDVFFLDANTGWAAGRNGTILHTSDGGSSWAEQNSGTSEDLNKIFMVDESVGYVVGENGTVQKYDGNSWSAIDINFSQDMAGVYFLDENTGWISGDWGRIMFTDDGGDSWSVQMDNSTFTNYFMDLHMIGANEGWAVGTSGKVLKWDGSSWSEQSTPASSDLESVHFSSANHGFISGDDAKIFHYDGSSWSEHSTSLSSESYTIKDVHVINESSAYAAVTPGFGGGGVILSYNGSTWTTEYENTDGFESILLYGIYMISSNQGYAVGAGGLIMNKDNDDNDDDQTVDIFQVNENNIVIQAMPNPVYGQLTVRFKLSESSRTAIGIADMSGKQVIKLTDQHLDAGHHQINASTTALSPGLYMIKIRAGDHTGTIQIIKTE